VSGMIEYLGVIAFGIAIGYAGLLLLGEYRKAFFRDARSVMTLEVLFAVARLGGPGYLAIMCLIAAVLFVAIGVFGILFDASHRLGIL